MHPQCIQGKRLVSAARRQLMGYDLSRVCVPFAGKQRRRLLANGALLSRLWRRRARLRDWGAMCCMHRHQDCLCVTFSVRADRDRQAMAFSMSWRNWSAQAEPMTIPGSR
jgi:hypothetical protein